MAMFKAANLPSRSRGAAQVCGYDHVDGDYRARFRHAGEKGLCPVLKLRNG